MVTVNEFYAESGWGLRFGAYGPVYTIVPGRHLGQDIPRTGDVPALLPGKIIRRVKTSTMAWGVVTDIGGGLYLSYWHLADDNIPPVGTYLQQGDRVGRLAMGARNTSSPDWPGTAWTGPHCHIVIGTNPGSAYLYVPGHRTLDAFRDPLIFIRQVLASAAEVDSKPFDPTNLIKTGDTDMKAIRLSGAPDSGIIIRGLEAPSSMDDQVFQAQVGAYKLDVVELAEWQYETCIREQWAAFGAYKASMAQSVPTSSIPEMVSAFREAVKDIKITVSTE